jgi:membrane protease subunit HflC
LRYRRLFETAQDGILIINADAGRITEVNPFLVNLLGYCREEFINKTLWHFGPFKDIRASMSAFQELLCSGYIRYEHLPLETKDGRRVEVEFISNVYKTGRKRTIQCNIRDISQRKQTEKIRLKLETQLKQAQKAVIVIVLFRGFYTLEEGQQAIVLQFGRPVSATVTEAGLHVKLPFVQEVRRFEKRLLVWDGDPNQIPTKGREFIWVDTTARWRIADARKFLENVASEEGAQNRLNDILDSVVRDQVSSSELVELVRSASWKVPEDELLKEVPKEQEEELKREIARGREQITRTILAEARKIIPQYGIELVDVRIKRLDYVESVRAKVYERMISERKRIAAQFRSEGEGRSAEILGTMEKELRQIRSTAYRRVQEVQGKADADATRIYGQAYNKNPEFYAFLRTLESYKEKTNKNSVMILTTGSDFYQYIKKAVPSQTQAP